MTEIIVGKPVVKIAPTPLTKITDARKSNAHAAVH
jgi:hypothetical protein